MIDAKEILSRQKIFAHKERIIEWLNEGLTKPITAEIDITNKCIYDCKNCAGGRLDNETQLNEEQIKLIINKLSSVIRGVVFTGGGEPLINPNVDKSIKYIKQKGIDVGIITNGFYLNNEINPNLLKNLLENCQWIRISLDAYNEEQYYNKKNSPKNSFNRVLKNISELIKTRNQFNFNCTIGLGYLTENETLSDLEKFVLLAKQLQVDNVQFRPYHHSKFDLRNIIEMVKIHETNKFKIFYPSYKYDNDKNSYTYKKCFADEFRIVISSNGDLYPDCFSRGKENLVYGKILSQSFEEIWNSKRKKIIFKNKLSSENLHPMSRRDLLNQILWDLYQNPTKYDLDILEKKAKIIGHLNFV